MKRGLCITIAVIMIVSMAACGAPVSTETASPSAPAATPGIVTFADPVLEAMVREAINKPEGDITLEEAAAITELKLSTDFTPDEPAEGTVIKDLSGLENFNNLEVLELHFHDVADISPLAGLNKLWSLGLGGNPVADLSPLTGMTTITSMTLFNCQAKDYSPLATLTNLNSLWLEYSTIVDLTPLAGLLNLERLTLGGTQVSDVSPLSGLTNLKVLSLADCPITDYSPLAGIYPNLEEKDFTMAFSLAELGFTRIDHNTTAGYKTEVMAVTINHLEWGTPSVAEEADCITLYLQQDDGYTMIVGYYPGTQNYIFGMSRDGEALMQYKFDSQSGSFEFIIGDQDNAEKLVRMVFADTDDILTAPISLYNDTLVATFGMEADALYALPFERTTLLSLGFIADHDNAVCVYEQHDGGYVSVAVHRPEWGNQEYSVEYYASINGYNVTVWYYQNEQRYYVRAENPQDGTTADFEFFAADDSTNDGMSPEGMTVEEYFKTVYNDPEIDDVYLYSVLMAQQYISDTFGMSIDELYALPVGE